MKIFGQKHILQKIIITTCVVVLLFNFILPNISKAAENSDEFGGVLFQPIQTFILGIGDGAMWIFNQICGGTGDNIMYISKGFDFYDALDIFLPSIITIFLPGFGGYAGAMQIYNFWAFLSGNNTTGDLIQEHVFHEEVLPDTLAIPIFLVTPETIFSNSIPMLDVNIISPSTKAYDDSNGADNSNASIVATIRKSVSSWYQAIRNLALVAMLSMLVYIGIRIIISSSASQKSKYKEMIKDWIVGICLLFFMHYIMSFSLIMVEQLTAALNTQMLHQKLTIDVSSYSYGKELGDAVKASGGMIQTSGSGKEMTVYTDFTGLARFKAQINSAKAKSITDFAADTEKAQMTYTLIYGLLVIYTGMFLWQYIKRLIYMIFLTIVAPIVAATYPIDKLTDNKAQAFNMWLKEYVFTLLIQPLHLLIYIILIGPARDLAAKYTIYPLVVLGFLLQAEKIMKKFFNFGKAEGPGYMGGVVGGAAVMSAMGAITRSLSGGAKKSNKGGDSSGGGGNKIRERKPANVSGENIGGMLGDGSPGDDGGTPLPLPGTGGGDSGNSGDDDGYFVYPPSLDDDSGYGLDGGYPDDGINPNITYGDSDQLGGYYDQGGNGLGDSSGDNIDFNDNPDFLDDGTDEFGMPIGFGKSYDEDGFETLSDDEQARLAALEDKLGQYTNEEIYMNPDLQADQEEYNRLMRDKQVLDRQKQQELDRRKQEAAKKAQQQAQQQVPKKEPRIKLDIPEEEPVASEDKPHVPAGSIEGARTTPPNTWYQAAAPIAGRALGNAALGLGKGVLKAYGAATLATVGGLAGLASDKYENVAAFGLAGGIGGYKATEGLINRAEGLPSAIYNKSQELRDEYYEKLYEGDPEAYKKFINDEIKKNFKKDKKNQKRFIQEFGTKEMYDEKTGTNRAAYKIAMDAANEYQDHGVGDIDIMIKAMKSSTDGVSSTKYDDKRKIAAAMKKVNSEEHLQGQVKQLKKQVKDKNKLKDIERYEDLSRKIWL